MKRVERLFALAEYLRGRRTGVTAEALAERFDVTIRTIYRDLDALRDASLPLSAERGPGGGFALDRSYSLPPVNFTAREAALLLLLGKHATEMRLLPFTKTLDAGLEKVRGALSASAQRELLHRLSQLAFVGVPAPPVDPNVRAAVEKAWFDGDDLRLTYVDRNRIETVRVVSLCGVTLDRSETRLEVVEHAHGEPRSLRLDRIVRAEVVRRDAPRPSDKHAAPR